uniref:Uncharacterized protein n=1 Tax=Pinguiococcus pyrenoidosus TaxID=172671 RepID=A0A6U0UCN3_9STRA|mmetsp:Transcript_17005/g.64781  ORF Transcript_17005/g.64781 Transcript_17005/m.64781 type:complete len:395 (+) Transcript_17005:190-1374(+)
MMPLKKSSMASPTSEKRQSYAVDSSFTSKLLPSGPFEDTRLHIATLKRRKAQNAALVFAQKMERLKRRFSKEAKTIRQLQKQVGLRQELQAEFLLLKGSATAIQAGFRGMKGRQRARAAWKKRYITFTYARLCFVAHRLRRNRAALALQRAFRGKRTRRLVQSALRNARATTLLQRNVRAYLGRQLAFRRRVTRQTSELYVQALVEYAGRHIQIQRLFVHHCALRLQRAWRWKLRQLKGKRRRGRMRKRLQVARSLEADAGKKGDSATSEAIVKSVVRRSVSNLGPLAANFRAPASKASRFPPKKLRTRQASFSPAPEGTRQRISQDETAKLSQPATPQEPSCPDATLLTISEGSHFNAPGKYSYPYRPSSLPSSLRRPSAGVLLRSAREITEF